METYILPASTKQSIKDGFLVALIDVAIPYDQWPKVLKAFDAAITETLREAYKFNEKAQGSAGGSASSATGTETHDNSRSS